MIKNGIVNLIGQFFKVASSILVIPLLIQFLGIKMFGLLSWSTAILAAIQLAEGGLGSGLLYFLAEIKLTDTDLASVKKRNRLLTSGLTLLSISTFFILTFLWFTSPYLVKTIEGISDEIRQEVAHALRIGAILAGLRIIQNFFWATFQSQHQYKTYSVISTLQIVISNSFWGILAYRGHKDLSDYLWSSVYIFLIFTIFLTYLLLKNVPTFKLDLDRKTLVSMIRYNLGVWGSNVGTIIFSQGDKLVVANTLGASILGVYTIFANIVSQFNIFAGQVIHPVLPLISSFSTNRQENDSNLTSQVKRYFLLNVYISLGAAGFCMLFSKHILVIFMGNSFRTEYLPPFQLLAYIHGLYNVSVTGYYIMLGLGKSSRVMIITFSLAVAVLFSMYFLSPFFGFMGLILSNTLFLFVLALLIEGMNHIKIPTKVWLRLAAPPLAATTYVIIFFLYTNDGLNEHLFIIIPFIFFMTFFFFYDYRRIGNSNR